MKRTGFITLIIFLCFTSYAESFDITTLKVVKKTLLHVSAPGQSGAFAAYKLSDQGHPDTFPYMVQYEPYNDTSNMSSLMSNEISVYNFVTGVLLWTSYLDDVPLTIKRRGTDLFVETRRSLYRFRISSGKFLWRYDFGLSALTEDKAFSAKKKLYRSLHGQGLSERGKTFPVFDVSQDGSVCVISQDFRKLYLFNVDKKNGRVIYTHVSDKAGYRMSVDSRIIFGVIPGEFLLGKRVKQERIPHYFCA